MTWEETIKFIRLKPEYLELVEKAYFHENLTLNVERFMQSEEYTETLGLIKKVSPQAKRILDVGSGNGISAVAFALHGYHVTAAEPDPSNTVGAGAIRIVKEHYQLTNLEIHEAFAENIKLENNLFDIVYVRQAMHHAYNLKQFVNNLSKLIKRGGYLLTVRDHVIYNERDKQWFLENHPLQRFYGGENAFTAAEYREAMNLAGLKIIKEFRHFDSVINYFPQTSREVSDILSGQEKKIEMRLKKKLGEISKWQMLHWLYKKYTGFNASKALDESKIPGRMYSYLAKRKR